MINGEGEVHGDAERLSEGVDERVPEPLPVNELSALNDGSNERVAVVE